MCGAPLSFATDTVRSENFTNSIPVRISEPSRPVVLSTTMALPFSRRLTVWSEQGPRKIAVSVTTMNLSAFTRTVQQAPATFRFPRLFLQQEIREPGLQGIRPMKDPGCRSGEWRHDPGLFGLHFPPSLLFTTAEAEKLPRSLMVIHQPYSVPLKRMKHCLVKNHEGAVLP